MPRFNREFTDMEKSVVSKGLNSPREEDAIDPLRLAITNAPNFSSIVPDHVNFPKEEGLQNWEIHGPNKMD